MSKKPTSPHERVWRHVHKRSESECWPWSGAINESGYGRIANAGGKGRARLAHRIVWETVHGAIPNGMCVLHKCDNPPCCNPAHLWLGTQRQNTEDRHKKGRDACQRGERHGMTKLSDDDVCCIRERRHEGLCLLQIAAEFGVSDNYISALTTKNSAARRRWAGAPCKGGTK